jgi:hypothetical protein
VLSIATLRLSEIAGAFVVVGVPLIAAAWFSGLARLAVSGRRAIAPFLRDHADWTYGITAAVMALIFIWNPIPATGKPAGIIILLALAFLGTYPLRGIPRPACGGALLACSRASSLEQRIRSFASDDDARPPTATVLHAVHRLPDAAMALPRTGDQQE